MSNNDTNYRQVVEMTDEEKIKMYMKQRKRKLAEMLVAVNNELDKLCNRVIKLTKDKGE